MLFDYMARRVMLFDYRAMRVMLFDYREGEACDVSNCFDYTYVGCYVDICLIIG